MASVAQDYCDFHIDVEACAPIAEKRNGARARVSKNRGISFHTNTPGDKVSNDVDASMKKSKSSKISRTKRSSKFEDLTANTLRKISTHVNLPTSATGMRIPQKLPHMADSRNQTCQPEHAGISEQIMKKGPNFFTKEPADGFKIKKLLKPLFTIMGQDSWSAGSFADGKGGGTS